MSPHSARAESSADWRRPLRYLWRLPLLVLHVPVGLAITMAMINPWTARRHWRGERLDSMTIRLWSLLMMRAFGMRVRRFGTPLPGAAMFVAKAEIAAWPVIGWLAARGGTIFHHRGDNESLHGVMHQMLLRLQNGSAVCVFPEGRTCNGQAIGVFHARIFQPAVLAEVPAQPVALKYGDGGCAQTVVAFRPKENFLQNFWRLLGEPARPVEVHFLEPVSVDADGRRRMAAICRERIIAAMAAR
jgi:1-acyl-sn-glycerol-3-phosphate acyltransferase